jgi:hypothetical protein
MKSFATERLLVCSCALGLLVAGLTLSGCSEGKADRKSGGASLDAGKTETQSSMSSSSTLSSSDGATFSSRHVQLLIGDSPHPLLKRIGILLAEQLKESGWIEQLDITQPGAMPAEGAESPDLFVRIELADLKTEGIVTKTTRTIVEGSFGNAPWQSSHYIRDSTTAPLVHLGWDGTLESQTTFTGVRTDPYAALAQSIASQFSKAISNELAKLSTKFPPLPRLPDDFYGPYQPPPDFPFLNELKARRETSSYGLFTHNQTYWTFHLAPDPVPQLQQIVSQLEADGWKSSDRSLTNTTSYFVRLRKKDLTLELFRAQRDHGIDNSAAKGEAPVKFVAHYRQPFSPDERHGALQQLLSNETPVETLLAFASSFSSVQRREFHALLEKTRPTSAWVGLTLAESYLNRKETNSALRMLLYTKALSASLNDSSSVNSRIEQLAKKLSPQEKLQLEVTPDVCRELGFIEIAETPGTFELERQIRQPLLMFGPTTRGLEILSLTISPERQGNYPWTLAQASQGTRSWSSSNSRISPGGTWDHTVTCGEQTVNIRVKPAAGTNRVAYSITMK